MISKIRRLEIARTAEDVVLGAKDPPIDPIGIAQSRGILVQPMETAEPGVSGFLMKCGDSFGIGYAARIRNPGFINFTVAHELGHYFLPGHVEKLLGGGSATHASHSGFIADDPCEREADLFAATLLMPDKLFRRAALNAGQGFPAVESLSQKCRTSITATAIRLAEISDCAMAIIVSNAGVVEFCGMTTTLAEVEGISGMRKGDPVPSRSTTARFQQNPQNVANGSKTEGLSMLDEWLDGAPRVEMKEDVVGLGHYGRTLTVLFTEEEVATDGEEDEDSFEHLNRWRQRA